MAISSTATIDYMRIEVATLMEDVLLKSNDKGKFKISTLMTKDDVGSYTSANNNIENRQVGTINTNTINMDNTIDLSIPFSLKMYFQKEDKIPKGTQFLIAFVGADCNKPRIIGLSSEETLEEFEYSHYEVEDNLNNIKDILEVYDNNWAWNAIKRLDKEISNLYATKADKNHSH